MSGAAGNACKSYIVTASMAAVEALKDQGFARWNYPLRCIHNRLKSKVLQSSMITRSSSTAAGIAKRNNVNKTERTMSKVLELDCWGPTTTRF